MAGCLPVYFSTEAPEGPTNRCHPGKTPRGVLVVVIFCLFVCGDSRATTEDSAIPFLSGTYLQLLDRHLEWQERDWRSLFDEFKTLRISKLVIQWSVSSDLAFYPSETFHCEGKCPLEFIMKLADETGIGVRIGLWHDPDFWNNIKAPNELLESYLRHARHRSTTVAKELAPMVRSHSSFQGWYISEEIDDSSWNEPARRKILLDHLAVLTADLREITPEARVGISAFSNARLDPESFGEFWEKIITGSSIDILYFQDGIGSNKLELNYLPLYLDAANRAARATNCTLAIVVELFEQKIEEGDREAKFQAVPASISRIKRQMDLAARYAGDRIMAFSIPDYMQSAGADSARRLYNDYVRKYIEPDHPGSID